MNYELGIMQFLLNNKEWSSSSEITSTFNISTRTVRTIVKTINSDREIILSSQRGYKINNEYRDYVKSFLIDNKITASEIDNSEQRQEHIIKKIFISNKEINFYDLIDDLYVSDSTLNGDLVSLRKRLKKYQLTLERKKEIISINGEEKQIRKLMSDVIYNEVKDGLLNFNILNNVFPEYNVFTIKKILNESIITNNLAIDDFGITDLVLHICIMLDRISINKEINETIQKELKDNTLYSKITKQIFKELEKANNITISDREIIAISPLIAINTKQVLDKNTTLMDLPKFVDKKIITFVQKIISNVLKEYSINLNTNDFIIRFSLHLSQLLSSVKKSNRNPLLKNIKDSYPLVFEISVYIANLIHKNYPNINLDDHEISYIALHVGMTIDKENHEKSNAILIIPDYYNLKDYIINRLYLNFYNSLCISCTYNDESEIDYSENFDIILSTQSLSVSTNAEYIKITPFINDTDLINIQHAIELVDMKGKIRNNEPLFNLFDINCFKIFNHCSLTRENIIKDLGYELKKQNFVNDSFIDEVIDRERISSTAYSNLAVPHTLNISGLKTCIAVGIFPDNYQWETNTINIVLILVIQKKDKETFKNLFQNIIRIFTSKEWLESYKKISNYDDYMDFIKKLVIFK